ncbi:Two-component sensor histidine kinase, contains HisKA and HATPase domains [Alkalispirochaeta americana]|uniref:histidine kinase n=1 Tax=Alkalispirochaeta americana TaxID=159291 RepID=A0A1N6T0K8_9SPIO|nr:sensor histidine kinase [Alkalispirochaeta americana]SIQ46794.1 Two-component sensor histidine kinase, contains HisKA and HATPase domains [Alkalispirochaeta americana]
MNRFFSLRARMVLAFGGVSTLLLIAAGGISLFETGRLQRETVDAMARQIVEARSAEVGRWLEGHRNEVRILSRFEVFRTGSLAEISAHLQEHHAEINPEQENIFFVDLDGNFITSDARSGSLLKRQYIRDILTGRQSATVSDGLLSLGTGNPIVAVAREILTPSGERRGIIGASVTLQAFSQLTRSMEFGTEGYGAIVDGQGLVVGHPDPALVMRMDTLNAPDWKGVRELGIRMIAGEAGSHDYRTPQGIRRHAIFAPVPDSPNWSVAYLMPQSDIVGPVWRIVGTSMVFVLVAILGVVTTAVVSANYIAAPILGLHRAVAAIDLNDPVISESFAPLVRQRNEIGLLAQAVLGMNERILHDYRHIQDALREKDLLLKEVHHRVKNNLQIVSSILSLQGDTLVDPMAREALRECENRIHAIAAVHECSYKSSDFSRVPMDNYLQELCASLQSGLLETSDAAEVSVSAAGLSLPLEQAISCGFIVTEVVTNSLKYAFPRERSKLGKPAVRIHMGLREDQCILLISDNGVGLGAADSRSQGLGTELVMAFASQLKGSLRVTGEAGVTVEVVFPPDRGASGPGDTRSS